MTWDRVQRLTDQERYRQIEDGVIESHASGLRSIRVNGRAHPYKEIGSTWLDADNATGDLGRLAFAYGNPLVPLFFDRATKPGAVKAPPSELTPILTSNWICALADYQRSASWTSATFNYENQVAATIPTGGRFDRWGSNRAEADSSRLEVPREPGTLSPRAYWYYDSPEASAALGLTDGTLQDYYDQLGEDESYEDDPDNYYTVTYTVQGVSYATPLSLAVVGGQIFCELEYTIDVEVNEIEVSDGEVIYDDTYSIGADPIVTLFALDSDPGAIGDVQVQWGLNLSETGGTRDQNYDIIVTGGRVALFYEGPYLYHVDAETGGDLQELDLSSVESSENYLDTLGECVGSRWIGGFAKDDDGRVWFGGYGVGLTCVNLPTNTVAWTLDPASNDTVYQPTGFAPYATGKFNLLCGAEKLINEEITNLVLSLEWSPTHTPEVVTQLQAGLSHLAGMAAINPDTGEEVGFTAFEGQELNGSRVAPFTDYVTALASQDATPPTWTTFANPSIDPYDPNEPPGTPAGGPFGREVYQPPTSPHWRGYSGNPLDWGWIVPPSFADYYFGELTVESYQSTNATTTHIEGVGTPGSPGSFSSVESKVFVQAQNPFPNPSSEYTAFENAVSALTTDQEGDGMNDLRRLAASIETEHRQQNGDWVRADVARFTISDSVALWDSSYITGPSPDEDLSANTPSSAVTQFEWQLVNQSTLEQTGSPPAAPVVTRRKNELGAEITSLSEWLPRAAPFVADAVEPSKRQWPNQVTATSRQGWSEQYAAWEASRTDIDTPSDPWAGLGSSGATCTGIGGGVQYITQQILIWRPKAVLTDRFKTPAPALVIGPTCMTGRYLVLGPRYKAGAGYKLQWNAYDGNGGLAWTQEIDKSETFPGNPISVGLPSGVPGVVTFYNDGGTHYIVVLNGDSGEVLYDAAVVSSGTIIDAIFGDGTFWSLNSNTGLTAT